jgi:hypothetical protein
MSVGAMIVGLFLALMGHRYFYAGSFYFIFLLSLRRNLLCGDAHVYRWSAHCPYDPFFQLVIQM